MQVILTPTAVADLFGPGLNGFKGDVPPLPPPTQVSAEWLNSVQMELVNAVISQGYALDGLNYSQLTTAINNWAFSGSIKINSGASLLIKDGGTFQVESNGEVYFDAGSIASFSGDLTFPSGSSTTFEAGSSLSIDTITGPLTIGANTASSALNIVNAGAGRGLTSTASSNYAGYFASDASSPDRAALYIGPQDANPATPAQGDLYHNLNYAKMRFYGIGAWQSIHSSEKGYVLGFNSGADGAAVNSGAIANVTIAPEAVGKVLLELTGEFSMGSSADNMTLTIYDETLGAAVRSRVLQISVANEARSQTIRAIYSLPNANSREFSARVSGNGGSTLTWTGVHLSVIGVG